jgi:Zn-dependent protease with chaperone function
MLPVLVCAISTAISLDGKDPIGFLLSWVGIFFVLTPRIIGEYWYLIRKKLDHRGGPATFSMWLLYWYRLERSITGSVIFFIPILAIIPKWRIGLLRAETFLLIFFAVMYILRLIAVPPPVYRLIDRIGSKLGFPKESKHYK